MVRLGHRSLARFMSHPHRDLPNNRVDRLARRLNCGFQPIPNRVQIEGNRIALASRLVRHATLTDWRSRQRSRRRPIRSPQHPSTSPRHTAPATDACYSVSADRTNSAATIPISREPATVELECVELVPNDVRTQRSDLVRSDQWEHRGHLAKQNPLRLPQCLGTAIGPQL